MQLDSAKTNNIKLNICAEKVLLFCLSFDILGQWKNRKFSIREDSKMTESSSYTTAQKASILVENAKAFLTKGAYIT